MKILIADDHDLVRRGICEVLREQFPEVEIGEVSGGWALWRRICEDHWDLLILDMSMPEGGGLETLDKVSASYPNLPVLVFTFHSEAAYAIRAFKSGASGFLNKSCDTDELIVAIRKLISGGKYVTPSLGEHIAKTLTHGYQRLPHEFLSNRELSVMYMISLGKSPNMIANELGLSNSTIGTYRDRILEKLELNTTSDIIRYAIEHEDEITI